MFTDFIALKYLVISAFSVFVYNGKRPVASRRICQLL